MSTQTKTTSDEALAAKPAKALNDGRIGGIPIEHRAKNFLSLIKDLIRILEQENQILRNPKMAELAPLVREKEALMRLYEQETENLATARPFMDKIPAELAAELRHHAEIFDGLIKQNERELKIGLTVSEKIMGAILDAAQKVRNTIQLYNRQGMMQQSARPAPVAINRKF